MFCLIIHKNSPTIDRSGKKRNPFVQVTKLYIFLSGIYFYNIIPVMKKILALLGITAFGCAAVHAADIVYPQGKYNRTSHDNVYFMGTLDKGETLLFNNQSVKPASNGAFAINVPVSAGRTQALLRIGKDGRYTIKQFFIIKNKPQAVQQTKSPILIPTGRTVFVSNKEDTPLYSTPECGEFNILSHMTVNTSLIIDGRQGDFYRVYLTPTRYGWVHKNDVKMSYDKSGFPLKPALADFYNVDDKTVPDLSLYRVAFSRNLPYELIDNPNELIINIFNVAGMNDETLILKVAKHELVKYSTGFNNGDFTLLMKGCKRQAGLPLAGFTIVVDAGHGGVDTGALGIFRDLEKDINLQVALKLKDELEKKGASVYLTRTTDYDVPAFERIKLAKAYDANLFVSIHMGATPQGENPITNKGTRVSYYNESAKLLAENIKTSLISSLSTSDAGIKRSSNELLQPTEYLGVNVDLCNMVNPDDSVIYRSENFVQSAANGITNGIVKYVSGKQNAEDSGQITNIPSKTKKPKTKKGKWFERFKKSESTPKRVKVKPQPAPEETFNNSENMPDTEKHPAYHDNKQQTGTDWLNSSPSYDEAASPDVKENWFKKLFNRSTTENGVSDEKPFLDTSVREKYQQEAIYVIDKNDTKWYRPRGKKKRVKRPPRVIKQDTMINNEQPVNIFASGDYEEPTQEQLTFKERCRNFLSKFTSYFYNAARN